MKFHKIRKATDDSIINDPQVISFCSPHFSSNEESKTFIKRALRKNKTRWMFNRVRWFIEIANEQRYDSLKVLFLLAMAETSIKFMENRYEDFRDSGPDVKKFFHKFTTDDQTSLELFFKKKKRNDIVFFTKNTSFMEIIEILLNVRNTVAHGKNHYNFRFQNPSGSFINRLTCETGSRDKKKKVSVEVDLSYEVLRFLMLKYAILNIQTCF